MTERLFKASLAAREALGSSEMSFGRDLGKLWGLECRRTPMRRADYQSRDRFSLAHVVSTLFAGPRRADPDVDSLTLRTSSTRAHLGT